MSQYNEAALAQKLNRLQDTQDSINALSQSAPSRKLAYLYLANDVVQSSRRKGDEFVREFAKVFPEALPHAFKHSPPEVQLKIGRILGILQQRRIYTSQFVDSIKDSLGSGGNRGSTPPAQPSPQTRSHRAAAKSNSKSLPEPTSGKRASAAAAKKNIVTPSEDSDSGESAAPTYLSPVDSARTSPTQLQRPLPTKNSAHSQAPLEPDFDFPSSDDVYDSGAVDQKPPASVDQKKPATPKAAATAQKGKKPQASKIVQIVSDNKVTGDVASIAQHLEAIKQLDIAKATQSLVMTAQEDADDQGNNQPIIASLTRYRLTLAEDIAKRTSLIRELQTLQERMLVFVKGDQIALQKCNERIAYLHSRRKSQTVAALRHTMPKVQHPSPAQQQGAVMMDIDQSPASPQPAATAPSGVIPTTVAAAAAAAAAPVPQPVTPVTPAAPRRENREYIPYSVGQIVAATPEVYAQEVAKLLNADNNENVQAMGVPMPAGAPGRAQLASSISNAIARAKDSPVIPVTSPVGAPSPVTPSGVPGPVTPGAAAAGAAPAGKAAVGTAKAAVPGGKAASTYIKPATPAAKGAAPSSAKAAPSTVKTAAAGTAKATPKPAVGRPITIGRPTPAASKTAGGPIRTKVSGPNPAFRPLGRPPTSSKPATGAPATPQTSASAPTVGVGQVARPPATMQTMQSIAIPADGVMAPGMAPAPVKPQGVPIAKTTPAKQMPPSSMPSSGMPPSTMPPGSMASGGPPRPSPSPRVSRPIAPPPGTAGAPPPQAGFKHLSTVPATQLVAVPVHAKYAQQPAVVGRPRLLPTATTTGNPGMPSPRPIAPRPGPPAPGQPMRPPVVQQGAQPMPAGQPRPVPRPAPASAAGQGGLAAGGTAPMHPAPPTPMSPMPTAMSTTIARPGVPVPAAGAPPPSSGGAPTPVVRPTPVRPPAPAPRP
ncbi:Regulation of nuclear pre-mRNA domain-containing protein 1A [Geranomyces variabilis]|uniref:Regulation of nuclear pre-mRNA domain-containing protein 1A n=1 Tax=Geranomyces variabilis TaxID=109894 RepID=A0AAD5XJJ8_9FUNG|nr:Regulation of nuclear pre-mRNA domain-containing protein 1A [Geranomyces variabilis]